MKMELIAPKVADVIAALEKFPQDAPVILIDADTDGHYSQMFIGNASEHPWAAGDSERVAIWLDYHANVKRID